MIECAGISLSFADKKVIQNLSFAVDRGTKLCITGPSGRGKSSLLKMLQGYLVADEGVICIDGMEIAPENMKMIREKMAYVPQNIHLPVASGEELLHLLNKSLYHEQALYYLKELELSSEYLSGSFDEMSGGQKQRVVIAICLALGRDILLLDEPTASLDEASISTLITCINKLSDITVIAASHNEQWLKSADKVIHLSDNEYKS